jgi:oligosaccharide reducing-end xylanase
MRNVNFRRIVLLMPLFALGLALPPVHAMGSSDSAGSDPLWAAYFGHPDEKLDRSNPGNGVTELYYNAPDGNAFIYAPDSNDVRTEGMSYGMFICVETNHQAEFDKLWKWVKAHMAMQEPGTAGYNYWHCHTDGTVVDDGPAGSKCGAAPDGEEYFATALFLASHRWGDGSTGLGYSDDAKAILNAMINNPHPMFVTDTGSGNPSPQVVFVPSGGVESTFTDPSYHLPAFYELWAGWDVSEHANFWKRAAKASREFLRRAADPKTGLTPDYANFDGTPYTYRYNEKSSYFTADAWRVVMNAAVDWKLNHADPEEQALCDRVQAFILSRSSDGNPKSESGWSVDGKTVTNNYGDQAGLLAMNAVASLAATNSDHAQIFLGAFADRRRPNGYWRYYQALLFYLADLQVSGTFEVF